MEEFPEIGRLTVMGAGVVCFLPVDLTCFSTAQNLSVMCSNRREGKSGGEISM